MLINYEKRFLEKLVLGKNIDFDKAAYNSKTSKQSDEFINLIKACVNHAYDAMRQGKNVLNKGNKGDIVDETIIIISSNYYVFDRKLIDSESKMISKKKNNYLKNGENAYGVAQKIINMSFKYFYAFNEYLKFPSKNYKKCECPIDSGVLENINKKEIKWTKMDKKEYECCQKIISKKLKNKKYINNKQLIKEINNLAYDFIEGY